MIATKSTDLSKFQIGEFSVEPALNLLTRGNDQFSVEPKIMDVLCALATNGSGVMSRDALIDKVWTVQFGGDESLSRAVSILRKTFVVAGDNSLYIATIPKRGYKLVQTVNWPTAVSEHPRITTRDEAQATPANNVLPSVLSGYSIAVVAIESTAENQDASLADDIGRDLVAMLSRDTHLRVSAYEPTQKNEINASHFSEAGRRRKVRYIVSGSLHRADSRMILRISLVDASEDRHIISWRLAKPIDKFNGKLNGFILDLSTILISEIQIAEGLRAHTELEGEREGYQILQSIDMLRRFYSEQRAYEITDHLRHLLELEPDNAMAQGALAIQLAQNVSSGWTETPAAMMAEAQNLINAVLAIAPNVPNILMAAGIVSAMQADMRSAIRYLTRSIQGNPNNPHALAVLGWQKSVLEGDEQGIKMIRTAERRAPHHPRYAIWAHYRGICEGRLGRFEYSADAFFEACERNPNYFVSPIMHGVTLALLHRDSEARNAIRRGLAIAPHFTVQKCSDFLAVWAHCFPEFMNLETYLAAVHRVWPD